MFNEILIGLLFVGTILVLALIGFITVLRWMFGAKRAAPSEAATKACPWCNQKSPPGRARCDWCGRPLGHPLAETASDLAALVRLLQQFRNQPWLPSEQADRMIEAIARQRNAALDEAAGVRPTVAPPAARPIAPTPQPAPAVPREKDVEILVAELLAETPETPPPMVVRKTPVSAPVCAPPPAREAIAPAAAAAPPAKPAPPPPKPAAPAPPPVPRRTLWETLAGFLEQRNIPVGELVGLLVGGLLVVGSSIALVISFREKVETVVYLKYAIFTAVSSLIFGMALYAFHRWKLEATGRGMLQIATLLVPLNFLAMASMSTPGEWSVGIVAVEAVSLGLFTFLVGWAAKTLVPGGFRLQTVGVIGAGVAMLATAHSLGADCRGWTMTLCGLVPALVFCAATVVYLLRLPRRLDAAGAAQLLTMAGTTGFAAATALGLLIAWGAHDPGRPFAAVLPLLSPWGPIVALPVLAVGLTLLRTTRHKSELAAYRTAGTAIALAAVALGAAALLAAWPRPDCVFPVAAATAAISVWAALRYRLPAAHLGAVLAASEAWLLVYPLSQGVGVDPSSIVPYSAAVFRATFSAPGGAAMLGLVALLGAAAAGLWQSAGLRHARPYAIGAAAVALLSAGTATYAALWGPASAAAYPAAMYAAYAMLAAIAGGMLRRREPVYAALTLAVGATLWTLRWQTDAFSPVWGATLALESLVMAAVCAALHIAGRFDATLKTPPDAASSNRSGLRDLFDAFRIPLAHAAEAAGALALVLAGVKALDGTWQGSAMHGLAPLSLLCVWLWLAWVHDKPWRTLLALGIAYLGLLHAAAFNYSVYFQWPYVMASLVHAALVAVAAAAVRWASQSDGKNDNPWERRFVAPAIDAGLVASMLGLLALLWTGTPGDLLAAKCLYALTALWIALGWLRRSSEVLGGAQAASFAAAVILAIHFLSTTVIAAGGAASLTNRQAFQTYGLALAATCLAWQAVRGALRWMPEAAAAVDRARSLLGATPASVDTWVRHGVIACHAAMLLLAAASGSLRELSAGAAANWKPVDVLAGPVGWTLLAVTIVSAVAALWHTRGRLDGASALLASATLPLLVAVGCDAQFGTATAVRWLSACGCVAGAAAICGSKSLSRIADRTGAARPIGPGGIRLAEAVLVIAGIAPVVLCSVAAAVGRVMEDAGAPLTAALLRFFAANPSLSYLPPLLAVLASLAALAVARHASGFALAGGILSGISGLLGYVFFQAGAGVKQADWSLATAVQWATLAAGAWALAWTDARWRIAAWRDDAADRSAAALLRVHMVLLAGGFGFVLLPSLMQLVFFPHASPFGVSGWTASSGGVLGWITLAITFAAMGLRGVRAGRGVSPNLAGWAGMAALGTLACTVRSLVPESPEWGYRTLMLGTAVYALLLVAATSWVAGLRTAPDAHGPPQALLRAASGWVSAAGLLAVFLGLKAAWLHSPWDDVLWGSGAIAVAGAACATMAYWRRNELWAFAAGATVNLAASLVVWYFHAAPRFFTPWSDWWAGLLEANVIATAAVALAWLSARRRLYQLHELSVRGSPLLAVQVALGAAALLAAVIPAAITIVADPSHASAWCDQLAAPAGWIALALLAFAAGWYVLEVSARDVFHVAAATILTAGVLGAVTLGGAGGLLARLDSFAWPSYHVLLVSWAASATLILAAQRFGWVESLVSLAARTDVAPAGESTVARFVARGWCDALCAAVLAAALCHVGRDPAGAWWTAGPVLALALATGLAAVWHRLADYVYVSAVLVNVAGTMAWFASASHTSIGAVEVNAMCLALSAGAWSIVGLLWRDAVVPRQFGERQLEFAGVGAVASIALAAAVAAWYVLLDLADMEHTLPGWLSAAMLAAAALATALRYRPDRPSIAPPGFYALGLVGLGMGLAVRGLRPEALAWTAGCELAAFAAAVALGVWAIEAFGQDSRTGPVTSPDRTPRWQDWWPAVHGIVTLIVALLGAWIALDVQFDHVVHPQVRILGGRMAGPIAVGLALLSAIVVARWAAGQWRRPTQYGVLGIATLAAASLGWALLPSAISEPTMHRWIVLLAASSAAVLTAGLIWPRFARAENSWTAAARETVPALFVAAVAALAALLVLEVQRYVPFHGVELAIWAKLLAATALVGLGWACVAFAVWPKRDPLGASDTVRQGYVYTAEAFIFLICLHFRLTWPDLFRMEIMRHYWMLIVVGTAFIGAGLAEWFRRRDLPILAMPLIRTAVFLPLAPALAFFFLPQAADKTPLLGGTSPAVWFLASLFYAFLAVTQRRLRFTIVATASLQVGLWVLLHRIGWGFLDRPQLWLIPPGLCILAAEYLNHRRLNAAASGVFRYLGLTMIYVSSTAEFLPSLGQSVGLALTLIGLSLAGVAAGVLLRVRSFLIMGVVFLGVVILSMIYHASRTQTWILWICCILLGLAIIAAVGAYEKHRPKVLAALRELKGWQR